MCKRRATSCRVEVAERRIALSHVGTCTVSKPPANAHYFIFFVNYTNRERRLTLWLNWRVRVVREFRPHRCTSEQCSSESLWQGLNCIIFKHPILLPNFAQLIWTSVSRKIHVDDPRATCSSTCDVMRKRHHCPLVPTTNIKSVRPVERKS
jgi:hypothetical protein